MRMETENPKIVPQDADLHTKVETQEKEIERLNEEVRKLRKCVRGVNVLGRALKETKKENERLLQTSMSEEPATDLENSTDPQSITTTLTSETNDSEKQASLPDMEATGKVTSIDDMESIDDFPDEDDRNKCDTNINEISEQPHLNHESNVEDNGQVDIDLNDQNQKDLNKSYVEESGQMASDLNDQNKHDKKDEEKTKSSLNEDKTDTVDSVKSSLDDDKTDHLVTVSNTSNSDGIANQSSDDDTGPIENAVKPVTDNDCSSEHLSSDESRGTPDQPQNVTNDAPGINSNVNVPESTTHTDEKQGNVNMVNYETVLADNTELTGRCAVIMMEHNKLKLEFKKVLKVNNEWESFWRTKNSSIAEDMVKKDAIIAELQKFKTEHETRAKETAGKINKEGEANRSETKELDNILLAEKRVNDLEVLVEQQRKEMTEERQKYERTHKLARSLLQQNKELSEEVKRLNGTLQTKTELYKSLQLSIASAELGSLHNGSEHEESHHQMTEPPPIDTMTRLQAGWQEQTQMLRSGLKYERDEERHQRQGSEPLQQAQALKNEEEQLQPKQHIANDDDDSMSAEELKERIMLLKEQKNAYESDFNKERRDREDVVGELERTKERLERAKQKVKQKKSNRGHRPPFSNYVEVQTTAGHNQPVAYLYPPNERTQLVAHGVQQRAPQHRHNDWYRYPDQPIIEGHDGEPPCLCPRHHYHRP